MIKPLTLLAALSLAAPISAQESPASEPALSLEQETAFSCGIAFAVAAGAQSEGAAEFAEYPPLNERGREYFVRTTAQIMDETGADREAIGIMTLAKIKEHKEDPSKVHQLLPPCLTLLEASGL